MDNLQRLISDDKTEWPGWFKPSDLAVMMVLACADGPLRISHGTLAKRCAASVSSVQRSLAALEGIKWVTSKTGARILTANTYEVCWERIPWTDHKRVVVTETARALARAYAKQWTSTRPSRVSRRTGKTYRLELPKNCLSRWPHVIQKHGLDAGRSPDFIAQQITYMAHVHPHKFAKGPQGWLEQWDSIAKFDAQKGAAK
jgi:hypothetical protein